MQLVQRSTQASFQDFHFASEKPSTTALFSKVGPYFALASTTKGSHRAINQEGHQVIVFSFRMRGYLVTNTFYHEASSQSILINAQGTKHLSQSIIELIKYTNQETQDKLTNAINGENQSAIILVFKRQILNLL